MKNLKIALISTVAFTTLSLPMDWHGEFQVDTNKMEGYKRAKGTGTVISSNSDIANGTQEVGSAAGEKSNFSFQSYLIKLKPEIIINDSTTFKAELTTGYGHGGRFGDSAESKKKNDSTTSSNFTNALYTYDTVSDNSLNLTQAYAVFYADTATYKIGRQSTNWALGAIHNSGEGMSSRFSTIRDGITIDFKVGNFNISPYYAKISSTGNLTKAARVNETGVAILYDNLDTDFGFGLLYAKNKASNFAETTSPYVTNLTVGKTDIKITDIYLKKGVGNFTTELEIPLLSGDLGHLYSATQVAKYKAKAILWNNTYKSNNTHSFHANLGKVSGDSGTKTSYEAMFLHPNFQVANILFKYNLNAVADNKQNVFDSYISNVFFAKFSHMYNAGNWSWENSFIWAKAEEVAKAGSTSYNHSKDKYFTANYDQADDLGMEIDSNLNYKWNTSVNIGANFGYLFTGDYYGYTNTAKENETENSYLLKGYVNLKF